MWPEFQLANRSHPLCCLFLRLHEVHRVQKNNSRLNKYDSVEDSCKKNTIFHQIFGFPANTLSKKPVRNQVVAEFAHLGKRVACFFMGPVVFFQKWAFIANLLACTPKQNEKKHPKIARAKTITQNITQTKTSHSGHKSCAGMPKHALGTPSRCSSVTLGRYSPAATLDACTLRVFTSVLDSVQIFFGTMSFPHCLSKSALQRRSNVLLNLTVFVATFRIARLTLQTRKLWLVGRCRDRP